MNVGAYQLHRTSPILGKQDECDNIFARSYDSALVLLSKLEMGEVSMNLATARLVFFFLLWFPKGPFTHAIFHAISMRFWCDFAYKTCPILPHTGF